ncbi:MAG TPA: hypothetical protein VF859_13380 [Burkholderiales bacterium]
MPRQFLVYLTAEQVSSHLWEGDRLVSERAYPATDEGRAAFEGFLRHHNAEPIPLLIDVVEEDYRFESVPHLVGPDRGALFERKLEQYYRATPYRHAAVIGREAEGRRDDRVVFSALTNPGLINPWVEMMARAAAPLRGVYSVPLVSRELLAGMRSTHVLLLTWEARAGLRQSYFVDDQLRFTRLTGSVEHDRLVERVASETTLTVKYLASLSLLPRDHPLDICILCDATDRAELNARLRPDPALRHVYLDVQELGGRIGYRGELNGSDATPLLLHALAKKPPPNQYANTEHAHFFTLWRMRRGLLALAATVLVGTGGWSLYQVWDGFRLQSRAAELTAETRNLEEAYRRLTADFPKTGVSTGNIKVGVTAAQRLAAYSPPPGELLLKLSAVLDAFPAVQVGSLSWQVSFQPESVGVFGTAEASNPAGTPSPQPSAPHAGEDALPAQVMILSGEIWPFNGDYRAALDLVERVRAALAQQGLETAALKLPLDLRPEATLAGGADEQGGARRAPFSLRIVWRRKA